MKDLYFECKKCGHQVYTDQLHKVFSMPFTDCPNCGEEGVHNWIVIENKK